jgi:hypothetical protein
MYETLLSSPVCIESGLSNNHTCGGPEKNCLLQYTKVTSVLEMMPESVGKGKSVSTLTFSSDGSILALGGASLSIRLHSYDSILEAGTRYACVVFGCACCFLG